MKRIALMAVAAVTALAPIAATSASADPWDHGGYDRRDDHGYRGDNGRVDTRDERAAYREGRQDGRWDARRHNGYNYGGRWYYGAPPAAYYGRPGYAPGYHAWRRGERVPDYYRGRFAPVDYRYAHLRAPPRGYHWVRDDRGSYLLVGLATGVILSAILSH